MVASWLDEEFNALVAELPGWQDQLNSARERYAARHHGDFEKWAAACSAALVATEQPSRAAALMALKPWRKGPWQLDQITIDTEWRSDWKWQRLAAHLNPLRGGRVLDIGCGNGYFGWRLLEHGASCVVGVDPTLLFCMQHLITKQLRNAQAPNWVIPLRGEELPSTERFECVLSMGVIYHRKDPAEHVAQLAALTRPGGTVVLESLVVEGPENLLPSGRYARMRNVSIVPTPEQMVRWLEAAGLHSARIVDVTPTTIDEQRSTPWMTFESLSECLDQRDPSLTVEGYPAPVRAIVLAQRP